MPPWPGPMPMPMPPPMPGPGPMAFRGGCLEGSYLPAMKTFLSFPPSLFTRSIADMRVKV